MRNVVYLAGACVVWCAAVPTAHAEEPPPTERRTVITPTRTERPAFDSARSVYTLGGDELRREMSRDVPEALVKLPGVHDQRTNRGAAAPILRGLVGPQNLLMIDGVRFSTSIFRTGPNQYAALIAPEALRGAEVMLGPGSVLYGSDALGGTINYLTRELPRDEGVSGEVGIGFASADLTLAGDGHVALDAGPFGGWMRAGYRRHGTLRTGGGDEVPASGFDQVDWGTKLRLSLGDDARITALYLGTALTDAGRIDNLPRGDIRYYDNVDHFAYLRYEHRFDGGFLRALSVTAHAHHLADDVARFRCDTDEDGRVIDRSGCVSGDAATPRSTMADEVTALGLVAMVEGALFEDRLSLSLGVEGRHERVGSARVDDPEARGNFSDGSTYAELGAFLHAEWMAYVDPGVFELVVDGGLRGTAIFARAPDVPGLGDVAYDDQGVVGGGSVRALFGRQLNVYASFWQGFRAPNLQETTALGDTGQTFEVPNDGLGPERAHTLEAGVKAHVGLATAGFAAFRTWLDDAIVGAPGEYMGETEVDGKEVRRLVNATSTRYDGVELSLEAGPFDGARVWLRASYIDGVIEDEDASGATPRRLPPFQGTLGGGWGQPAWHDLFLGAEIGFAARQTSLAGGDTRDLRICGDRDAPHLVRSPCLGTPGWWELRLMASATPVEGLRVHLLVANVLDASYRSHGSGHDAPGIDARVGARYAF